jgi:hypothetical protein
MVQLNQLKKEASETTMYNNELDNQHFETIQQYVTAYEKLTGLCAEHISHDEHSFWIRWSYPDSSWAGTTAFDMPLTAVIDKLDRQIAIIGERLELVS